MRAYLDNNATTPPAPEVVEAMRPFLEEAWGNPSSVHGFGRRSREGLDRARHEVARLLGCSPKELCFTASGSEANALAVKGVALAARDSKRRHVCLSALEHPSVELAARALERLGFEISWVPVDASGVLDAGAFEGALRDDTLLAAAMLANNETGLLQPVPAIAEACRRRGALLHVDAVQAAGKVGVDCRALGCDLLSVAAHKFHGPRGAAALFVRRGVELQPLVDGHQEGGRRGGTEDVAALAGFGRATALALEHLPDMAAVGRMRDELESRLLAAIPGAARNGAEAPRIANTTSLRFEGCDGETVLIGLDLAGIAASAGAACSSGASAPSHVLRAMGLTSAQAQASLRFSLSRLTRREEVDRVVEVLPGLVDKSRREAARDRERAPR